MSESEIRQSLLGAWPSIPADDWERLSEHRWRAPHPHADGVVECVVTVFGETLGQGVKREDEAATWPKLFEHAARLAAHREACGNGTPAVRPNDEANFGVVGRCWWCGKWPEGHAREVSSDG